MKFITIFMILLSMFNGNRAHALNTTLYPTAVRIVEIADNDLITGEDANGEQWQFYGSTDDYYAGDIIGLIMSDSGTPDNIYDDVVIADRYTGFWFDIDN